MLTSSVNSRDDYPNQTKNSKFKIGGADPLRLKLNLTGINKFNNNIPVAQTGNVSL